MQPAATTDGAYSQVLGNVSNLARATGSAHNAIIIDDSPVAIRKLPSNVAQSKQRVVSETTEADYDDPEDKDYVPTGEQDFVIRDGQRVPVKAKQPLTVSQQTSNPEAIPSYPGVTAGLTLPSDNTLVSPADREKQLMNMMTSMVALVDDVKEADMQVPGLKCTLMPHQVQGVRWMMSREAGVEKGGILADDMGLGKTVQTIALILQNRPGARRNTIEYIRAPDADEQDKLNGVIRRKQAKKTVKKVTPPKKKDRAIVIDSDDEAELQEAAEDVEDENEEEDLERTEIRSTTTLIIAPVAVIGQWEKEIATKSTKVPPLPLREAPLVQAPNKMDDEVDDEDNEETMFYRELQKVQRREAEKHAAKNIPHSKSFPRLRVLVHHGSTKAKTARQLREHDVVITTYNTVVAEYKNTIAGPTKSTTAKASKKGKRAFNSDDEDGDSVGPGSDEFSEDSEHDSDPNDFINDDSDLDEHSCSDDEVESQTRPRTAYRPPKLGASKSKSSSSSSRGIKASGSGRKTTQKKASANGKPAPLFDMDWLRIVLDEAQNVKNHNTQAAKAAFLLSQNATSRWCLTGTPIQNTVYELWSLIHFLRIKPFDEYAHFKDKIGEPLDPKKKNVHQMAVNWAMKRLHVVLQAILLRRTKETTHEGKKLIELPPKHISLIETDFDDPRERKVYNLLETRIRARVQEAEEAGSSRGFGQMQMLMMLMRLRQACSHPALLQGKMDIDISAAPAADPSADKPAGDLDDLAALVDNMNVGGPAKCEQCSLPLEKDDSEAVRVRGEGEGEGAEQDDDDEDDSILEVKHLTRNGRSLCRACCELIDAEREAGLDWRTRSSTKVNAILRILGEVRDRGEEEKTIVFSQFTTFLDLLEPYLRKAGFKYERYDGSMRPEQREYALSKVQQRKDKTVLLISFRAGSTGLNLTFCNHVILTEAWWNPALEDQAFDRAHRLGQTRETYIYKLSVTQTVDERILEMQAKKRQLAESALEGTKMKANRLDRAELLKLFGAQNLG